VRRGKFDCFIPVGAFSDNLKFAGSFQKRSQPTAHKRVIVDDQHANRSHVSSITIWASQGSQGVSV
jgi:hypothetical protein